MSSERLHVREYTWLYLATRSLLSYRYISHPLSGEPLFILVLYGAGTEGLSQLFVLLTDR